ncbi:hypothetical protein IWW54_002265 [Coemansia sp. RSA 2705]|nr:hypothetical protein IWW54_002265 [Coemansia sp. RSA 2705]
MRAVDLYTYLVENIPESQDDVQVFANCAFRTSYLFTALPLRLFVELCGGIEGLSALLPYIRDGDGDSVEDDEVDIDGVNARLAAPVRALPTRLHELLQDRIQKTRPHIRQLLYALETLQLIKPIRNAKDAMALASPPAAEDAFSRVLIDNPKSLHYGYQLVGRARLLNREGYLKAQSLFSSERMGTVDLTTNYLNDETYDMFDPLERFRYISNLEVTTRDICADLAAEHPLYGIGIPSHWKRPVKLVGSQMRSLDQHVDAAAETTPLTDVERLREAAAQAGVTPEEARRYYQHVYASMRKAAAKRVNDRERLTRVRKKVREAANRQFYAIQASGKAPEAVRRLNFSEAESRQIIIWNVVLRYHAQEHKHMFALSRFMANMFPTRFHAKSPADALRCHWERMRKQPESRAMIDKMYAVWKYVLRDAVAAGSLVDDPDIEQFDAKSAVLYFDGLLQRKTLNDLVVKYARGIAEDAERGQTQAPAVFGRTSTRNNPARRKVKRTHKQPTGRLPATMRGQEHRYAIEELHPRARDVTHCEFAEDTYRDSLVSHKRRDHAYSTVLTTHRAYGASVDYSCPITTMLANEADGPASEVLRESPLPFYVEPIGRVSTLARRLNAPALAERLARLVDGANIEDQAQCLGEGGYSVGQRYAESVCMQAQVLNLTLTPEREYNVDEGSQLLAQNKDAATRACNSLTRILAISRLRPMAASVGLDSSQKQTSTVVVHETTGATRTNVREAGAGLGVVGEEAGYSGRSDDTATKNGTAENGTAAQRTDAPEERMVPGRGYAASERLYTAISTTLPDELWDTDLSSTVTSLDRHLNAVELRYACSLLASGKLWVRPQYTQLRDHQLHAMSGFKRFEVQDAIEFGLNVVAIQPPDAPMELDKELPAPNELVDRIVLGTVDAVGPLGASELELSALYQKLAGTSAAQGVFSTLPVDARSALFSAQQVLQSLCRLAALRRVFVVGSGDCRYVSATVYHKHWAVSLNGVERAPRLGLNTSGSVNVAVTGGVLASVLGRVFDNPGISQAALIRRYFAPFVSKFEVLQYLDMLVELGVVRAESVDEDVDAHVPHRATYYHLTPEFYGRLPQVASAMATAPNF